VTLDLLQMSKINGQRRRPQRDITYQHKNCYMSRTDRLNEFKV